MSMPTYVSRPPLRADRCALLLALGVAVGCGGSPTGAFAQGRATDRVAGDWIFRMDGDDTPQRVALTADGDSLRGRVYGQSFAASLDGARLAFAVGVFRWRGAVQGDTIRGWLGISPDSSRWSAVRYRRPPVPRSFVLAPTSYVNQVSSRGTPQLRVHAGDTIRTSTVDAGGWGTGRFGAGGNRPARGGNPLVGPIVVEGALPGDVLAVTLVRVRLNRDWAFSGTSLVDYAIEPSYAAERKFPPTDDKWVLDTLAGVARLAQPSPALAGLSIPLAPFLGVIAVAPRDGVAPSSRDSGPWGGNMEYAQLREGTTVYLPVQAEGAWLHLGDGHAAQGDGELTGDALETSMDVTFTVDLQRYRFNSITRAESEADLMSIGVAGSLDEAMRRATSDMARWLERQYRLTSAEAAIILGFAVRYDIPDLVPPWVSVVARVPKRALPGVGGAR